MMRLVDTSAWIEWLIASPTGLAMKSAIPVREDWLVPTIVQLDTKMALAAAEICGRHKLATADAIVYATALEHGADLLTCDAHFDGLPNVDFVAKIGT